MKKILSTTLTAVALSVAVVSTVDARMAKSSRPTKRRTTLTTTKQTTTKQTTTSAINENAQELINREAPVEVKRDAASELIAIFKENPNEFEYAQILILIKQKTQEIEAKQDQIAAIKANISAIDFWNVELKKARGELAVLKTERENLKKQLDAQEGVIGKETSKAVKFGVAGLTATLGLLAIDQIFLEGHYRKAGMAIASEYGAKVGEYGKAGIELGKAGIAKGGEYLKVGVDTAKGWYDKTPDVPYIGSKARAKRAGTAPATAAAPAESPAKEDFSFLAG